MDKIANLFTCSCWSIRYLTTGFLSVFAASIASCTTQPPSNTIRSEEKGFINNVEEEDCIVPEATPPPLADVTATTLAVKKAEHTDEKVIDEAVQEYNRLFWEEVERVEREKAPDPWSFAAFLAQVYWRHGFSEEQDKLSQEIHSDILPYVTKFIYEMPRNLKLPGIVRFCMNGNRNLNDFVPQTPEENFQLSVMASAWQYRYEHVNACATHCLEELPPLVQLEAASSIACYFKRVDQQNDFNFNKFSTLAEYYSLQNMPLNFCSNILYKGNILKKIAATGHSFKIERSWFWTIAATQILDRFVKQTIGQCNSILHDGTCSNKVKRKSSSVYLNAKKKTIRKINSKSVENNPTLEKDSIEVWAKQIHTYAQLTAAKTATQYHLVTPKLQDATQRFAGLLGYVRSFITTPQIRTAYTQAEQIFTPLLGPEQLGKGCFLKKSAEQFAFTIVAPPQQPQQHPKNSASSAPLPPNLLTTGEFYNLSHNGDEKTEHIDNNGSNSYKKRQRARLASVDNSNEIEVAPRELSLEENTLIDNLRAACNDLRTKIGATYSFFNGKKNWTAVGGKLSAALAKQLEYQTCASYITMHLAMNDKLRINGKKLFTRFTKTGNGGSDFTYKLSCNKELAELPRKQFAVGLGFSHTSSNSKLLRNGEEMLRFINELEADLARAIEEGKY